MLSLLILVQKTSSRRLKTSWLRPIYLSWLYVFKTSSRRFQDVLPRCLQNAFKTCLSRPIYLSWSYVFKTSSRRFQDVFKASSRHFQDVFENSCKDVFKTLSSVSLSYTVLVNMFSRCLQDVFTTFLRRTAKTFTLLHLPRTQLWEIMVSMQILKEWQQFLKF